jgi:hypothetical protein
MTRLCLLLAIVALAAIPVVAADTKSDSAGFVQLFNGKDLAGWKMHPDDTNKWEVKDGALTSSGPGNGHLYSQRGDYENVVFRVEAKINDKGNSGQYVRARFQKGFPAGYEAQINATHSDPIKTGSLYPGPFLKSRAEREEFRQKFCILNKAPHAPDEWFTQEFTADGNHLVIKVNDKTTVDYTDQQNLYTKGHLAIQYHDPTCKVMVRKAEVKELPSSKKY